MVAMQQSLPEHLWMTTVSNLKIDGPQLGQGALQRGTIVEQGFKILGSAMVLVQATRSWQFNEITGMQLEKHATASHVFELAVVIAPPPKLTELTGNLCAMPLRMISNQLIDLDQIPLIESPPLHLDGAFHETNLGG
jgi:hypothetical protein